MSKKPFIKEPNIVKIFDLIITCVENRIGRKMMPARLCFGLPRHLFLL